MTPGRIDIITMGCSKNLIDSERLLRRIEASGYSGVHNSPTPAGEFVVVNTCGFIGDAKEESINMILSLAELKKKGEIGNLIVMGCLSERYRQDLQAEIPEVDKWYGKFDWNAFIESLPLRITEKATGKERVGHENIEKYKDWERNLTTPKWSAFVKVSEGCDRMCAYCAIPLITGRHKSRAIEEILEEVESLVKKGVRELNVIAQDLSSYGLDLYNRQALPELIDRMARIKGVEWIRLHYLYPTDFPMEILDVMNRHSNICKYLDIALQHISDKVLDGMNRKISKEETLKLLSSIREKVPGVHIRTTLMTGFPGEGEEEFEELLEFVKSQRFERLGGFAYCEEDDTLAARTLKDTISQKLKEKRLSRLMELQQGISQDLNTEKIGMEFKVLIEEREGNTAIGRTQFDSPEVDQEVYIANCDAEPGTFLNVVIEKAGPFELYASMKPKTI